MNAPAIHYGCSDPRCGYDQLPSTMGTPYRACPLCGARWIADPPPKLRPAGGRSKSNTGQNIFTKDGRGSGR